MNMKRAISALLTVILFTAMFIPTSFAEGEGVQIGGESTKQTELPGEQAGEPLSESPDELSSESSSESFENQSNEEITCFSVAFRDWDGTSLGGVQTVAQGSGAVAPEHPARDGYEPDGWDKPFTNVQSDLVVTAQYKLAENADMPGASKMSMPLLAQPMASGVTANDITVNLHIYLGNRNHVKDTLVDVTFTIKDITETEREHFEGLKGKDLLIYLNSFTSVDLSPYIALSNGLYYEMSFRPQALVPGASYEVNIHLKTNIEVNTHDIIFMVDGERYDTIEDVPYGADLTEYEMIAEPKKTGYTFSGWSPAELPATMPDEDVIISGTFTVNTHDIIFKVDGEEHARTAGVPYGTNLTGYLIAEPEKTGYKFSGWSALPATMPDVDVTVNGTFTVNTHYIIYMVDGVEHARTEAIPYDTDLAGYEMIAEPEKTGYKFGGWSPAELPATMPDEDVIISGTFTVNTHDIIFIVDGDKYDSIEDVPYGTDLTGYLIAEPEKEGHKFSGWSALPATMPDEDVTVSGTFTVNAYTVRFFAADGVTQIGSAQTVAWGGAAALETPPVITGFTFNTWTLTGDDDTVVTSLSDVRENIDAVATYNRNSYTVTFVDYDGTVLGTYSVLYGDAIVPPSAPTREGYTFAGWDVPFDHVTGNLRVSAQYAINIYTVTFVDYDGTVLGTDSIEYGGAATAPAAPTRAGYTFTGWDIPFNNVKNDLIVTATYTAIANPGGGPAPQTGGTAGGTPPQTGGLIDEAAPQAGGGDQIADEDIPQAGETAEEAVPLTGDAIEDEPVPAAALAAQQDLSRMWWLLLLLIIPLLLLLPNVSVRVYGRDDEGQEKLLRTIRRLKRKKDEVIVSLKARHVSGSTFGLLELTKGFTRRMRERRLILEVEGEQVISVAIPREADGRFQVRIDSWGK